MKAICVICGKEIDVVDMGAVSGYLCDSEECDNKAIINDPYSQGYQIHNAKVALGIVVGTKQGNPLDYTPNER